MSLISTVVTLMPHGSVCSSMIWRRLSLSCSRSVSSESRSARPRIDLSVVWAIWEVATGYASTSVMARSGSTTRK